MWWWGAQLRGGRWPALSSVPGPPTGQLCGRGHVASASASVTAPSSKPVRTREEASARCQSQHSVKVMWITFGSVGITHTSSSRPSVCPSPPKYLLARCGPCQLWWDATGSPALLCKSPHLGEWHGFGFGFLPFSKSCQTYSHIRFSESSKEDRTGYILNLHMRKWESRG